MDAKKDHIRVEIAGEAYDFKVSAELQSLTGKETIMLEDYLGGWLNFSIKGASTRSMVILVWLAKRSAGKTATLDEIEEMPGLLFGDAVKDIEEEEATEAAPFDASTPGNEAEDSSSTPETFEPTGQRLSVASTRG